MKKWSKQESQKTASSSWWAYREKEKEAKLLYSFGWMSLAHTGSWHTSEEAS